MTDLTSEEEARKIFSERISKSKHLQSIEERELDRNAAKDWLRALFKKWEENKS